MKPSIYLSTRSTRREKPDVRGMGKDCRVLIPLLVHSGPKAVVGKRAEIVCTPEEAIALALDIIGQTPLTALEANPEFRERLRKFNNLVNAT